jgi:DeoR/GlpR family transcriptional regulator of sugar metabolism
LPIASALQHCDAIRVLLLGGFLRQDAPDLCGELTEANLEDLRADVAFIGADGIDAKGNVYNASLTVGRMLRRMAGSATRVFVVADSSKIGRTALMRFGNLAEWDGLITDRGLSRSLTGALRRAKVQIIPADGPRATRAASAKGVSSKE